MNWQRFGLVALAARMALLSPASSKSTTTASPSPTPTPTAAATTPSPSASSSAPPTSTATASASATPGAAPVVVVHTGIATVSGKSENVLTNALGFTLYYHATDTPTSVCSATCAAALPPLLLPSVMPRASLRLR